MNIHQYPGGSPTYRGVGECPDLHVVHDGSYLAIGRQVSGDRYRPQGLHTVGRITVHKGQKHAGAIQVSR